MLTKRWQLLSAFAGGCLCSGVIVALWMLDGGGPDPRPQPDRGTSPLAHVVQPLDVAPSDPPAVAVPSRSADVEVALEAPVETGRSLAEIVAGLEAEYRRGASPPPIVATRRSEPEPEPAPAPAAIAPPVPTATVALASPAGPASVAPAAALPPASPSPTVAQPVAVLAPANDAPADVERVEREREARQRDATIASVYQAELYQQQQLAMLQYLALILQSRQTENWPAPAVPSHAAFRRSPTFSFPLTNPDNPWGFDLPKPVLAK
jgi:hypothetical protein